MKIVLYSAALLAVSLLIGCGVSSEGSRYNAQHGVAQDSGYPAGAKPTDAESPALGGLPAEEHKGSEKHEGAEGEHTTAPIKHDTKKVE